MEHVRGTRRVVCAANFCKELNLMLVAPRHWDPLMRSQYKRWADCEGKSQEELLKYEWDQGFIDQHRVWMDRKEAYQVAKNAGQIILSIGYEGDVLYSEHLY